MDRLIDNLKVEKNMEYMRWIKEIPPIVFDSDWSVQIIPPYHGTVVRFVITKGSASVSVYLDCYETLGSFGEPYWEAFPFEHDVYRCKMNDVDELLSAIRGSLAEQLKQ